MFKIKFFVLKFRYYAIGTLFLNHVFLRHKILSDDIWKKELKKNLMNNYSINTIIKFYLGTRSIFLLTIRTISCLSIYQYQQQIIVDIKFDTSLEY